jgi:hypothetical protein
MNISQRMNEFILKTSKWLGSEYRKIVKSTFDLVFSFFPMFVLCFILIVQERIDFLINMTDPIFLAATLFAEGLWRILDAKLIDGDALKIVGFLGAIGCCVIAVPMVIAENPEYSALRTLMVKDAFHTARGWLVIASAAYGFIIRYRLQK